MNNLIESINKPVSQMVKTKYLFKRYERHIEAATIAFNAGELTSKSAQKKALDSLSHCFASINALEFQIAIRFRLKLTMTAEDGD